MSKNEDFEQFWAAFPRRIGKAPARKAFATAIRKTDLQTMLEAIDDYVTHKPIHQDFCHPTTWLNQERWDDEWTTPEPPRSDHSLAATTKRWLNRGKEYGRTNQDDGGRGNSGNVALLSAVRQDGL